MKNMNDIFLELKVNYKELDIKLGEQNSIIITIEQCKIEVFDDLINVLYKNRIVTHYHIDNYDNAYKIITFYIENKGNIEKKQRTYYVLLFIIVMLILLLVIIYNLL